ncbi:MAG: ATP-binding cassette domain-containing protein [Bacteroidota bacterium]
MNRFLEAQDISVRNPNDGREILSVSFSQSVGERLAIIGETGSGKSTLLRSLAGLQVVDKGRILFENDEVKGPDRRLVPVHPDIKYLSQRFELPKFITVENYLLRKEKIRVEDPELVFQACDIEYLLARDTRELSGGERQRVAFAKELLSGPKLMLLDEPFSNLDAIHKQALKQAIDHAQHSLGTSFMLVAHEPADIISWAEKVIILKNGRIHQSGKTKEVYSQPNSTYAAELLGTFSLIKAPTDFEQSKNLRFHRIDDLLFLRPHHVLINSQGVFTGSIQKVKYFGSFVELLVESKLGILTCVCTKIDFEPKTQIRFDIKPLN